MRLVEIFVCLVFFFFVNVNLWFINELLIIILKGYIKDVYFIKVLMKILVELV